ncbi:HAD-IC family P-type ATPase [Tannockella kyphosi]|uniref:HAD-IC family P-type ATPase n=1 Tax=Tannockella kyphosi TaxID=2899121 RepID=UPI00201378E0|nr:HAD-IC family P-type ATPase [Tannockella kyphosi]
MYLNDQHYQGLTNQEVLIKIQNNEVNSKIDYNTKSYRSIVLKNVFTFFNFINFILFCCVCFVESYHNGLFIFIILTNTTICIIQEVKAKRLLDQISFLEQSSYQAIRDYDCVEINQDRLVKDDLIILYSGQQIPCDSILLQGTIEVNEAMLTGESNSVIKTIDDIIYSGTYLISGKCVAKIQCVGNENYINQLTKKAKLQKSPISKLKESIQMILKKISKIIVPLGILIFCKQYYITNLTLEQSVVNSVAAVLGMIPEGLVLLISITLSISIVTLLRKKVLVQELFCIETLAYVDTLCLDKTGTITTGQLKVYDTISYHCSNINEIISNMLFSLEDTNSTSIALQASFLPKSTYQTTFVLPFSSKRKYSAVHFENLGTYYLGAYQSLFCNQYNQDVAYYASQGYRVLVLAHSLDAIQEQNVQNLQLLGIILLSDCLRDNVKESLDRFQQQGIQCYVLSGDDPLTIANIVKTAGLDASRVVNGLELDSKKQIKEALEKYRLFGRVTPEQKQEIVSCLKEMNHTVAMTGDGINDILAFKEADCSIAFNNGNEACKHSADIVLLDNQFDLIHDALNEGRRVINNITASGSMFLIKTFFSIILCIITIVFGTTYPFVPIQLSILSSFGVGIPCFLLAYEKNYNLVTKPFLQTVIFNALPTSCTIAITCSLLVNVGYYTGYDTSLLCTICVLFAGWNYMIALKDTYSPLSRYRKIIVIVMQFGFYATLFIFRDFLYLTNIPFGGLSYVLF